MSTFIAVSLGLMLLAGGYVLGSADAAPGSREAGARLALGWLQTHGHLRCDRSLVEPKILERLNRPQTP